MHRIKDFNSFRTKPDLEIFILQLVSVGDEQEVICSLFNF